MSGDAPRAEDDAGPAPCAHTDYREGEGVADLPATGADATGLEVEAWDALYAVEDPEMPISVVDLGLIYRLAVEDGVATLEVTLTYSGCPAREMLTDEIRDAAASVEGIDEVDLELVWSPPWSVEMVTGRGREDLREFGLSV